MKKLIFIVSLTCSLCFAQSANQNFNAYTHSLMDEAKRLTNTNEQIPMPSFEPTTSEYMASLFCKQDKNCPDVNAIYINNTIFFKKDLPLNDFYTKSVLIHELIHHIQITSGHRPINCDVWYKNESQAYQLQAKYLKSNKQPYLFVENSFSNIKCP